MWYYATEGQKEGPVSEEKVTDLVREGDLDETDLVWTTGMDEWKQISEVKEIFPDPPPLPDEETPPELPSQKVQKHTSERGSTEEGPTARREAQRRGDPQPRTTEKPPEEGSTAPQSSSERGGRVEEAAPDAEPRSNRSAGEPKVKYASFGKRLTAYALDNLILFLAVFLLSFSILLLDNPNEVDIEKLARAIGLFGGIGYFILFEASYKQATLGKQIMGLRVVDTEGKKIGLGKATLRTLGKGLSGAIFLIGFIMAGFTDKNQALHDKLSGCLVLEDSADSSFSE